MNHEKFEMDGIIRIILNQKQEIKYSNVNSDEASNYLEKLGVFVNLSENPSVQYNIRNYYVIIDRFVLNSQPYYVILITLRNDCSGCSKVLVDEVTGLYNRNYWENIERGTVSYSEMKNLTLILVDIDNLKEINDTYGHLAGDKAIEIVGQAIKRSIRKEDTGIRYGGDEFVILLPNQDRMAADKVVKRIRAEINKRVEEQGLDVQVSTGISCTDCLFDLEEMIKMADTELYYEKKTKKEQHKEFDALSNIRREIQKLQNELDDKIYQYDNNLLTTEIIELSNKLDRLILKYLEDSRKNL